VALQVRLSLESRGHDQDAEMALARSGRTAVSSVQFALVYDVKARRLKCDHEFFPHLLFDAQDLVSMI
jgi:hypothetical protein